MWKYLFLIGSVSASVIPQSNSRVKFSPITADGPLMLTPYIENGDIEEARNLALVTGLTPGITSYSGYFTVDKSCGSHMFFWFFPSQNDWLNDPVTVWLEGGPGGSSLLGVLYENGPLHLTLDEELQINEYSWNRNSSVIYIDNPVGTGFSFTENLCYNTNQDEVSQALLNVLVQFFQLFPELKSNPFYITGESYAGKYIPALGHAIHNSENKSGINFKGVAIGNGWTDPINQMDYSDYLYQVGLLDEHGKERMHSLEVNVTAAIEEGNYTMAMVYRTELMLYFQIATNYSYYYNYLIATDILAPVEEAINTFLNKEEIRNSIHVGNISYGVLNNVVFAYLFDDFMRSVKPWLEELLDNDYRVILYDGQIDVVLPYPLTVNMVKKLEWKGAEDYKNAERDFWFVEGNLAGYSKTVGNFTEVLVRNAGHLVPTDQPKVAFDLFNRFIFNAPIIN